MSLSGNMDECPAEWENFIWYLWGTRPERDDEGIPTSVINDIMSEYNAKYFDVVEYGSHFSRVEFQNEEDYIIFKLRYGGIRTQALN
jgi:hypothetical protein